MGALSPETIYPQVFADSPPLSINLLCIDSQAATLNQIVRNVQDLGHHGLRCLKSLLDLRSLPYRLSSREILLSVIAFTSSRDTWTSPSCTTIAASILLEYAHEIRTPEFIIEFLLQNIIRPLFSKSKPPTITATGRKAMLSSAQPRNYNMSDSLDPALKPWKYLSPFSITLLEWTVENASVNLNSLPVHTILNAQTDLFL